MKIHITGLSGHVVSFDCPMGTGRGRWVAPHDSSPVIGSSYHVEMEFPEVLSRACLGDGDEGMVVDGDGTRVTGIATSEIGIPGLVHVRVRGELICVEAEVECVFNEEEISFVSRGLKLYPIDY